MRRLPPRPAIAAGLALALLAGAGAFLLSRPEPEALQEFGRAQEASGRARSASSEIAANLQRIADNISAAEDLDSKSSEIRELTEKQRGSLSELLEIMRSQLEAIDRSAELVEGTERASKTLALLGRRQAELIREAVDALMRLRGFARDAGTISGYLARQAIYGARLAEDSEEAFSEP
jgi:methyl-accepting chemotaxis protein